MQFRQSQISTHTPHARRDIWSKTLYRKSLRFQLTRLMRGVTLSRQRSEYAILFQLTRLMRGVTSAPIVIPAKIVISTHTPHARRDIMLNGDITKHCISTHTPHARRDEKSPDSKPPENKISTHTPHARRDVSTMRKEYYRGNFNSHASCEA